MTLRRVTVLASLVAFVVLDAGCGRSSTASNPSDATVPLDAAVDVPDDGMPDNFNSSRDVSDSIDAATIDLDAPQDLPIEAGDVLADSGDACKGDTCVSPCATCPEGTVCVWGTASCESEMITIPAGPFWMGCTDANPHVYKCTDYPETLPFHVVDVPAFEIDRLEATVEKYRKCVEKGSCGLPYWHNPQWDPPNYWLPEANFDPVNYIPWSSAHAYCLWAGKRLCSEAEWEKASRGPDSLEHPWGNEDEDCDYHIFNNYEYDCEPQCGLGCGSGRYTAPAGSKPLGASPYGVLDMVGNVDEWVQDFYHPNYQNAPTDGSAWLSPPTGMQMWRNTTISRNADKSYPRVNNGFRCCRSVPATEPGSPQP